LELEKIEFIFGTAREGQKVEVNLTNNNFDIHEPIAPTIPIMPSDILKNFVIKFVMMAVPRKYWISFFCAS
jgi:hypothetical protein